MGAHQDRNYKETRETADNSQDRAHDPLLFRHFW